MASRFISDVTLQVEKSFPFHWRKDWLLWIWGNLLKARQPLRVQFSDSVGGPSSCA